MDIPILVMYGCDRDLWVGLLHDFNPFTLSAQPSADCIEGYFQVSALDPMLRYIRCGEHSALDGRLIFLLMVFTLFVEMHPYMWFGS